MGMQSNVSLKTRAAIVRDAVPVVPVRSGIYFLIRGGIIVYVGQSTHIDARIAGHVALRHFDGWSWVPCDPADLNKMERRYIDRLMPEENLDSRTRRTRGRSPSLPVTEAPVWDGLGELDIDPEICADAERKYTAMYARMAELRNMRVR